MTPSDPCLPSADGTLPQSVPEKLRPHHPAESRHPRRPHPAVAQRGPRSPTPAARQPHHPRRLLAGAGPPLQRPNTAKPRPSGSRRTRSERRSAGNSARSSGKTGERRPRARRRTNSNCKKSPRARRRWKRKASEWSRARSASGGWRGKPSNARDPVELRPLPPPNDRRSGRRNSRRATPG